ncbi:hypothetical protein ACJX0J_016789, partial [Zea mays]
MPSLQKALPPELADNVLRLYRECLRRAKYISHQVCIFYLKIYHCSPPRSCDFFNNRLNQPFVNQKHNTKLLVAMVRQQFKKNMHETDPEKIQKMKD